MKTVSSVVYGFVPPGNTPGRACVGYHMWAGVLGFKPGSFTYRANTFPTALPLAPGNAVISFLTSFLGQTLGHWGLASDASPGHRVELGWAWGPVLRAASPLSLKSQFAMIHLPVRTKIQN